MYTLKTEGAFDSAHFLHGYDGPCRNIHGHRWQIEAEVGGDALQAEGQERGMLMDFSALKKAVRGIADALDHKLIYEAGTLKTVTETALREEGFALFSLPFRPTAENLARYICAQLTGQGFSVVRTVVYETPNNCAVYLPPEEGMEK